MKLLASLRIVRGRSDCQRPLLLLAAIPIMASAPIVTTVPIVRRIWYILTREFSYQYLSNVSLFSSNLEQSTTDFTTGISIPWEQIFQAFFDNVTAVYPHLPIYKYIKPKETLSYPFLEADLPTVTPNLQLCRTPRDLERIRPQIQVGSRSRIIHWCSLIRLWNTHCSTGLSSS